MLGYWIVVSTQTPEERDAIIDRKKSVLAEWETGVDGIRWLEKLVEEGKATKLRGDGYPNRYTSTFVATIGAVIEATTGELRNYETGNPDAEYESIVFGGTPEGREALRLAKAVEAAESTAGVVFSDDERARMSRLIRDAQLRTKSH